MMGFLFSPVTIVGTAAVTIGFIAMVAKNQEDGRAWFAKKFGDKWQEKVVIQFIGWPLIVVGLAMYFPDHFWIDLAKLGLAFVAFIFWSIWKKKKNAQQKTTVNNTV
jgi:hypothetical protein